MVAAGTKESDILIKWNQWNINLFWKERRYFKFWQIFQFNWGLDIIKEIVWFKRITLKRLYWR